VEALLKADTPPPSFPPGVGHIFGFVIFNALSFQMVLGSPMVLYAKSLGASATVLGLISGMMSLLVIFQIPASKHVANAGYKRFVLAGWSTRVVFIFLMALVPAAELFLTRNSQLSLLLFLLFFFNLSRGISSCGWLPWITSLIPSEIRGRYLAREAAFGNVSSFIAFVLAGVVLGPTPGAWQFAILFAFSAVAGTASLRFLKRIPEGESPEQIKTSNAPVPWLAIAAHPPFRKLLRMNVAWAVAVGGMTVFTVAFLKTSANMAEDRILLLSSAFFLGGLGSLWLLGSRLDRLGSKPALHTACLGWMLVALGWALVAAKVLPPRIELILLLQFLMGLGTSVVNMANTRLAMSIIPPMGRSHFFALFSVVGSLALGLAPILWGLQIDAFRPLQFVWHGIEFNTYTVFFLAVMIAFAITIGFCRRLEEPQAASMEVLLRDILEQSPLRVWLRFWTRG
jgi:MFS family permease